MKDEAWRSWFGLNYAKWLVHDGGMKVGWGREGQKKIELGLSGWVWGLYGFVLVWAGLCCSVNFVLLVIGWKYLVLYGNCW